MGIYSYYADPKIDEEIKEWVPPHEREELTKDLRLGELPGDSPEKIKRYKDTESRSALNELINKRRSFLEKVETENLPTESYKPSRFESAVQGAGDVLIKGISAFKSPKTKIEPITPPRTIFEASMDEARGVPLPDEFETRPRVQTKKTITPTNTLTNTYSYDYPDIQTDEIKPLKIESSSDMFKEVTEKSKAGKSDKEIYGPPELIGEKTPKKTDSVYDILTKGNREGFSFLWDTISKGSDLLDRAAGKISEKTGMDKGGAFKDLKAYAEKRMKEIEVKPEEMQDVDTFTEKVLFGLGAAPGVIATYAGPQKAVGPIAAFALVDAVKDSDKGTMEALKSGIKGAITGTVLKATEPLTRGLRAATVGGLFAGEQALEGGDISDIASAGTVGAILSQMSPGGKVGPKEAAEYVKDSVMYKNVTKTIPAEDIAEAFRGRETSKEAKDFVTGLSPGEKVEIAKGALKGRGVRVKTREPRFGKKPEETILPETTPAAPSQSPPSPEDIGTPVDIRLGTKAKAEAAKASALVPSELEIAGTKQFLVKKKETVTPEEAIAQENIAEKVGGVLPDKPKAPAQPRIEPLVERRTDIETRKRIDEMTPEELKTELLTSPIAGIPNIRAYEESEKKPIQVLSDIDGLKWINDNFGHEAGDKLIRAKAETLKSLGIEGYHLGGDEFVSQFDSIEQARESMSALNGKLSNDIIIEATLPDGSTRQFKGWGFSYGIGQDKQGADTELRSSKTEREREGTRASRGEKPPGLSEITPEGVKDNLSQVSTPEEAVTSSKDIPSPEPGIIPVFKDHIKKRYSDLSDEDVKYAANLTADAFEDMSNRLKGKKAGSAKSTSLAWRRYAETGVEQGPRGGLNAFEFGKAEFEKQLESYLKSKNKLGTVVAGDLPPGSKFTIRGEDLRVSDYNPETGEITIKDGQTYKLDSFDKITIDGGMEGIRPQGGEESLTHKPKDQLVPKSNEQIQNEIDAISDWVESKLASNKSFTRDELFDQSDISYGGTRAEGKYTPKDAFDAMEMGVNRHIMEKLAEYDPNSATPDKVVDKIRSGILDKLPSQERYRTEEQDEFQQFSTPPDLAYAMAWSANIKPEDVVLEPSAGVGGLAAFAKNADAKEVIVNELSPRRAGLLKEMGFDKVYTENAEQINNILPKEIKPSVIIMNPPFSATAGRIKGEKKSSNVITHINQAMSRLDENGRLVVLIGESRGGISEGVKRGLQKLTNKYQLRASIGISGEGYKKYGTTYSTRLIIYDKIKPSEDVTSVMGQVSDVKELFPLLSEVRNERLLTPDIRSKQAPHKPGGEVLADTGRGETGTVHPPSHLPTDVVGDRGREDIIPGGVERPDRVSIEDLSLRERPKDSTRLPHEESGRAGGPTDIGGKRPEEAGGPERGIGSLLRIPEHGDVGGSEHGRDISTSKEDAIGIKDKAQVFSKPLEDTVYEDYTPQKLKISDAKSHPSELVESAAMASVEPVDPVYKPNLSNDLIKSGKISLPQIEAVVYAGQAHSQTLPDGRRKGHFIGDGTGVGKGREIAAIIMDNMNQGRTKALWISKNSKLLASAARDWEGISGDPKLLMDHSRVKFGDSIKNQNGILFTTYSTLGSGLSVDPQGKLTTAKGKTNSRLDQIIKWVGEDFDGVIVFDEAHNMQNSLSEGGERGRKKPALMALAGVELQKRLPQARIEYVSATGASSINALVYADRLGLWGEGTPFPNKDAFVNKISEGGLAAMEVVSRDMKAMGVYMSRNLSFREVTYEKLEHKLTQDQREIYDEMAKAWQLVLNNLHLALKETGGAKNGQARSAAIGRFWSAHQRFFNQVLTSLQMPSALENIKQRIDKGDAVVLQLVNTNEATQERQISKKQEEEDGIENLDLTPRENLMQYVESAFPVQQMEEYENEDGVKGMRPVTDSAGNPVLNAEAVALRDELLDKIGALRVPDGPLELVLNTFGPEQVAEVTGRKRRIVKITDDEGQTKTIIQPRSPKIAAADAKAFQDDKKQILVFSDAGGTGESYHADLSIPNQRKRVHYLIQPGWRADNAVQGFGRTHRSNEKQSPHYVLVTTDLKGQKRFISSVAKRLDQLGALTKGQRQTGSQGIFSEKDNLENTYAKGAVYNFFDDLVHGQIPEHSAKSLLPKLGLEGMIDKKTGQLNESRIPAVPQFLNRILSLEYRDQNAVFDAFSARMERAIEIASQKGTLDVGMQNYKADKIDLLSSQDVYTDPKTGAKTHLLEFETQHAVSFIPFEQIRSEPNIIRFMKSIRTGKPFAIKDLGTTITTEKGHILTEYIFKSPIHGKHHLVNAQQIKDNYHVLSDEEAKALWDETIRTSEPYRKEKVHLLSGTLLPIWDRLPSEHVKVIRIQTDKGERFLGRQIPAKQLDSTLNRLGVTLSEKGITKKEPIKVGPGQVIDQILDEGAQISLANGWTLRRKKVAGENRIEIEGEGLYQAKEELQKNGVFLERINYQTRFFIPVSDGVRVLTAVTKNRPIVDIAGKKEQEGVTLGFGLGGAQGLKKKPQAQRLNGISSDDGKFHSADRDIDSRIQTAKKGVKPSSISDWFSEKMTTLWHDVSRDFKDLPDTAEFSPLRTQLLKLQKTKMIETDKTLRNLADVVDGLSTEQYDLFEWKALLSDLHREAESGRDLPFGYTREKIGRDLAEVDRLIGLNSNVQTAWVKRQEYWEDLKNRYKKSMDDIGFDVAGKITKEDYFRHQVLAYAQAQRLAGAGKELKTPAGRGFLKKREGSELDINANYLQAEFEVMAQMASDIHTAQTILLVDQKHNIRDRLKAEAKRANDEAMARKAAGDESIEDTLKLFRQRIAMHMHNLHNALDLPADRTLTMQEVSDIAGDLQSPGNFHARGILKNISERQRYTKETLGDRYKTWRNMIPGGYETWQPREGHILYLADSIPAQMAQQLQEGMLESVGLKGEDLRKILAMGGLREEYVIPSEVATTLNQLQRHEPDVIKDSLRQIMGHIKALWLLSPRRSIRYNLRNLSGDSDGTFVGNPKAFVKMRQAMSDLWPVFIGEKKLTGEVKEWFDRGGVGSTLQFQEMGDLAELKAFKAAIEKETKGGWASAPLSLWNKYWKSMRIATDYRESILRYANYLEYLEQTQTSKDGKPTNYGASRRETVNALPDIRDRAYKLSNELLGAYDRISVAGHNLRDFWYPFWSWQEVNFRRYAGLVRNAVEDADFGAMGRMGIGAGIGMATRMASFLIKASAFWATLQTMNNLLFLDEEREFAETNPVQANRPHILFGRDKEGKILYLSGLGALGDLLSWFGLDTFPNEVGDLIHGRLTLSEVVKNSLHAPVNKIWGGITPYVKMPVELLSKQNFYPDVFRPRPIQNRDEYLMRALTLEPEYRALKGKPGPDYLGAEDVTGLLVQRTDPEASAYWTWQSIEDKLLVRMGKDQKPIFWRTPKGEALKNITSSIRYKDKEKEEKYRKEYKDLGGTTKGMEKSLMAQAPLKGMSKKERDEALKHLGNEDKRILARAEKYYKNVILAPLSDERRRSVIDRLKSRKWLSGAENESSLIPHELSDEAPLSDELLIP